MARIRKEKQLLEIVLEDYMYYCSLKDLRRQTLKSYEQTLKLLFKYLAEEFNVIYLEDIEEEHIKSYIDFSKEKGKYSYVADEKTVSINRPDLRQDFGKKVSMGTVNSYLRNIKTFFNYCIDNNLLQENPCKRIKNIKCKRNKKEEITSEEFNKIIKVLDLTLFSEYRDYVIIQLLADTGMRLGETLALKVSDIDLKNKTIFIDGEIAKGRRDRYVFFSDTMKKILQRWINYKDRYVENELLFVSNRNNEIINSNFEKLFKKYVKRAKIEKNITPHSLRNNFARRCLLNGMDIYMVSRILGHSDVRITQQAYMDITTEDIRKSYMKYSPLENMRRR